MSTREQDDQKGIQALLSDINGRVRFDEPMRPYTSFQIGGPADAAAVAKAAACQRGIALHAGVSAKVSGR